VEEFELAAEHYVRYQFASSHVRNLRVLDAACGTGYGTKILADAAAEVWGVDVDAEAVEYARSKYSSPNIHYTVASVDNLPFDDGSFDAVVSFETIEHLPIDAQERFLREIARVLSADGTLIISTPNKKEYSDASDYKNEYHIREFYESEFVNLLKEYFPQVKMMYQGWNLASVIVDKNVGHLKVFSINGTDIHKKYFVAICKKNAQRELRQDSGAAILDCGREYLKMIKRILELQDEVEERNLHIHVLDREIDELREKVRVQANEIEARGKRIKNLDTYIESLRSTIELSSAENRNLREMVSEREDELSILYQKIEKLELGLSMLEKMGAEINRIYEAQGLHSELLLPEGVDTTLDDSLTGVADSLVKATTLLRLQRERIEELWDAKDRLAEIQKSEGWRLLQCYYGVRDRILPFGTVRRGLARMVLYTLLHPRNAARWFRWSYLIKLIRRIRTETPSQVERRIAVALERLTEGQSAPVARPQRFLPGAKLSFPRTPQPKVSIIIPVHNQWSHTYQCLSSILEHTHDVAYEVILADDGSQDETAHVSSWIDNLTVVRTESSRGFVLNCNNAAKYAKGKYLVFLNNDTLVTDGWLMELCNLIESDSAIGAVGPKLLFPDGRLQEAGGIVWSDASGWNYGRYDDPERPEYNYVKQVDYISGACLMVRKELWERIGGFDERYVPAYYEDTDLAFEIRRLGYTVMYQPKSVVYHLEGASHGTDIHSGIKKSQEINSKKFLEKWSAELSTEHFPNGKDVFYARDRSRGKKTILVIDHYVPHPDKDAGSRSVYSYINLFLKQGFNVKFLGDNLYRHEPYTSWLQNKGVEVIYGSWYGSKAKLWIMNNGKYIDYVFLNRPHVAIEYISLLRRHTNAKILYYGHDLHHLREWRQFELTRDRRFFELSVKWKEIEEKIFSNVDVVYYPSKFEECHVKNTYPGVICRTIPLYILTPMESSVETPFDQREGILFVGGFSHTPNVDAVKWFVQEVFRKTVSAALPGVKFYVVGSHPPQEVLDLASDDVVVTGYVPDAELTRFYQMCRLSVAPLRYGAGVKGKVVESIHHGLPMVATSIATEGLPDTSTVISICDQPDTFAAEVIRLYNSPNELEQRSKRCAEYIRENFSAECAINVLSQDIEF